MSCGLFPIVSEVLGKTLLVAAEHGPDPLLAVVSDVVLGLGLVEKLSVPGQELDVVPGERGEEVHFGQGLVGAHRNSE